MNRKDRQTFQMVTSVEYFISHNVNLFSKGSRTLLEQFGTQVKRLAEASQARASAEGQLRVTQANRDAAVDDVKSDLGIVAQLTAAIENETFRMPQSSSVGSLIESGKTLLGSIPSIQADLAQHGFAANFAAVLETKVATLDRTQRDYLQAKRNRTGCVHAWAELLASTLHTLYRIDIAATLALQGNTAAMAEYTMARTVRKPSTSREEVPGNSQGEPVTKPAAA